MSWLKNSSIGASLGKLRGTTSPSKDFDLSACYDSFRKHWQQIHDIIQETQASSKFVKQDDVLAVVYNLDHMVTLLILELKSNISDRPCLEHVLSENLLDCLYNWSLCTNKFVNALRIEQLKLYEVLISHSHTQLLVHEAFHRPLLRLLTSCSDAAFSKELEKRLIVLLNQLCVSLVHHKELLHLFFHCKDSEPSEFVIFSLLIPFIHRDGATGQQARDALLFCMSLSKQNESVALYIAHQSNVCPVLATGLSGLYSLLPCKLPLESNEFFRISNDESSDINGLSLFMNSLEFCNAVIQVAHPIVSSHLLEFLYQGFLVPVMGPALLQNSEVELITSTAYFDLFIRSLSEPGIIYFFVKFLFKELYDDQRIIDCLILRINSDYTQLSAITIGLFETLINLNCEDVMFELIFKYLIPCNHVMASQRCKLSFIDSYCKSAEKFLLLSPNIERSENVDGSLYGNYFEYLLDARQKIASCAFATSVWQYYYDGESPSFTDLEGTKSENDGNHSFLSSDDVSSGYESFAKLGDIQSEAESGPQSYSPTNSDICPDAKHPGIFIPVPTIGPFLEALFSKLEKMLSFNVDASLLLTGLISRLAVFPQPLLRSFLLDHSLVFQPSIKSLIQIISLLKQKIEEIVKDLSNDTLTTIIKDREKLLIDRERSFLNMRKASRNSSSSSLSNESFDRNDNKRRSLSASIHAVFKRVNISSQPTVYTPEFTKNEEIKKKLSNALILTEWLRELAAIAQEHTIFSKHLQKAKIDLFV